jgi:hypothetical protein
MQTSFIRPPQKRAEYAGWRRKPAVLTQVLDAVSAVNGQLLDVLVASARRGVAEFPLNESLRGHVAKLTLEERRRAARCGVFLVDANFADFSCWREVALQSEVGYSVEGLEPWLPIEEARSLAHSALLVAWYVIHASPAVARVLLGMSASGVAAYRELGVGDLARIARDRSDCVRPRWRKRLDVWGQLIEGACCPETEESRSTTLRCLQVSAGDLKWLSAYIDGST